jgi:hypothetical protein
MVSAPTDAAVTTIAEAARINEMRKRRIEVLLAQFAPGGVSAASETRIGGLVKQCITPPRFDLGKGLPILDSSRLLHSQERVGFW